MRRVQCEECGKRYDFDVDDFCPRCGAFNQPERNGRVTIRDGAVRIDGINEANHQNSFTHQELHAEDRERKKLGLERRLDQRAPVKQRTYKESRNAYERGQKKGKIPLVVWIILVIVGFNVLGSILGTIMNLLYW